MLNIAMEAMWLWVRAAARRTRGSLALIAMLSGLSATVVLIALVGAQRTRSALDRAVRADDPGLIHLQSPDPIALAGLDQVPGVRAVLPFETFIGSEAVTGREFLLYMSPRPFGSSIDRIAPLQGRLPSNAGEVLLTEQAAAALHLHVGDTFTFASQSWEQFDAFGSPDGPTGNEPPGPTVPLQIVGIGSSLIQKVQPDDAVGWVTEEFAARYDREISHIGGADGFGTVLYVWVDGGEAAIAAVQHAMDNVGTPVAFNRFSTFATPASASTGTMASGALVFAVIAAVTGAGAIAVAVLRHVARLRHDRLALEVLGTTRSEAALLGAAAVVPAAVGAAVVTVVATLAASRLMPFGATARRLDPDVGALPSTPTLLAACAAVAVTIVAMALIGSWRWNAKRGLRPASIVPRMTSGLLDRWPAVTTGVGFAIEGRGASRPGVVRTALIAGSLGVAGVVGGASVVSALDDLQTTPARWGYTWTVTIDSGNTAAADATHLLASPSLAASVAGWAISSDAPANVNGLNVRADALDVRAGSIAPDIRRGRAPTLQSEVALNASLAADLRVSIGDSVTATTRTGSVALMVVGEATLYPMASGLLRFPAILMTPDGQAQIALDNTSYRIALLAAPGVSADELYDRLAAVGGDGVPPRRDALAGAPAEVRNAVQLRAVALTLALFTGALGLALVTNAVFVARRRRGHDLAVLRALGMTPTQTVRVLGAQTATISIVSLLIGVPVGGVAGRLTFAGIIEHAGADVGPATAWSVVGAIVVAVVVLTPVVAAWPAWRAARTPTATALGGE
jgi:ABC-type lipoprotein release transport system permease subunit